MFVSTAALVFAGVIAASDVGLAVGALAADPQNLKSFGFAYDYNSTDKANAAAISKCSNCKVVVQFRRACAAYARDQSLGSGAYGVAFSPKKKP